MAEQQAKNTFDYRAWLQLVRIPNLFSVPGDPWVGLVLVSAAASRKPSPVLFVLSALAALCFYAAGLVLNDLHDFAFDAEHRPERPLPSGRIPRKAAARACSSLLALGIAFSFPLGTATLCCAMVLVFLVCAYNLIFKEMRGCASLCMGLCRGGSLLIGAFAGGLAPVAIYAAIALTVYITVVTWIAARENETQTLGQVLLVPAYSVIAGGVGVLFFMHSWKIFPFVVGLGYLSWAMFVSMRNGCRLYGRPVPPPEMQPAIGVYIRCLIPWQAAMIAFGGAPVLAILLFALAPLAQRLSRRFAES